MKHAPESRYVSHEPVDEMVFVRLDCGVIDLSIYLSNEIDSSDEMLNAVTAWSEDTSAVIIAPHFRISSPVDYLIDSHQMPAVKNHIDIDSKPIFNALRAEFEAQIKRIDALVFSKEGENKNLTTQKIIARWDAAQ